LSDPSGQDARTTEYGFLGNVLGFAIVLPNPLNHKDFSPSLIFLSCTQSEYKHYGELTDKRSMLIEITSLDHGRSEW
jgi:hypothetical protein